MAEIPVESASAPVINVMEEDKKMEAVKNDNSPMVSVVEEEGDMKSPKNDDLPSPQMEKKDPEDPIPVDYVKVQNDGSSLGSSVVNMMNTIVGAGVLSIPSTVKKSGIVGAFLLLALSLYLSLEGAKMLSTVSIYTRAESYGMVAKKLNQPLMGALGDWAMIVFVLGISVAYFIILFSQVMDLIENWFGVAREVLDKYYPIMGSSIALFIAFPLLCIPSIDALKFISWPSIICISLFVIIAVIKGIVQVSRGGLEYNLLPSSFPDLTSAVSVFFSSLCCHASIPKMTSELRIPENSRFNSKVKKMIRIDNVAFLSCGAIYFVVGACGYLAYGNSIESNLLTNFSNDKAWYLNIVKLAYALVVLFSYPTLAFAAVVTFDKICFKKQPRPLWRRIVECFIWSAISCFIAIIIPQLDTVFGIIGSLCGFLVNFAIPAYFFIGMAKKERAKTQAARTPIFSVSQARIYGAWFLFYFGVVLAVLFTTIQLVDTIKKYNACSCLSQTPQTTEHSIHLRDAELSAMALALRARSTAAAQTVRLDLALQVGRAARRAHEAAELHVALQRSVHVVAQHLLLQHELRLTPLRRPHSQHLHVRHRQLEAHARAAHLHGHRRLLPQHRDARLLHRRVHLLVELQLHRHRLARRQLTRRRDRHHTRLRDRYASLAQRAPTVRHAHRGLRVQPAVRQREVHLLRQRQLHRRRHAEGQHTLARVHGARRHGHLTEHGDTLRGQHHGVLALVAHHARTARDGLRLQQALVLAALYASRRRAARTLVVPEGGRAELERLVAVAALLRHHRARRDRQVHAPAEDRHCERGGESAHGGQRHGELHRV